MITDHTNPLEAWVELAEDHEKLRHFRQKRRKKAIIVANGATDFPFFETVDYTPPGTRNTYKVFWRTDEDLNTVSGQYLPVQHARGKHIYLYAPETGGKIGEDDAYLWIITPHFQSRYRERTAFQGVNNVTELVCDILDNISSMTLSIVNHKKMNRNFFKYNNTVDGEACNRYMPMINGVAFIDETVHDNESGRLPRHVHVIEMRTFVDTEHLSRGQKKAVMKDVKDIVKEHAGAIGTADVMETVEDGDLRVTIDPKARAKMPPRHQRRAMEKKAAAKERMRTKHQTKEKAPERTFSDEEAEAILQARVEGMTLSRLAATYKTNTDRIRAVLQAHEERLTALTAEKKNKTPNPQTDMATKRSDFSKKDIEKMLQMHDEGKTNGEIARSFNTACNVVYHILQPYLDKRTKGAAEEQPVRKAPLNDRQVDNILTQVAAGEEFATIAARFDRTVADVAAVVNDNPELLAVIVAEMEKRKATEEAAESRRAEMVHMCEQGATLNDIMDMYGLPLDAVKKILAEAGVNVDAMQVATGKTILRPEEREKIMELRRQSLGTGKIAKLMNRSTSTVYAAILKDGDPLGIIGAENGKTPSAPAAPAKTLADCSAEDLIRQLYALGYCIAAGGLTLRREVPVADDDEMIVSLRKAGYNIDAKTVTRTVVDTVDVDAVVADIKKESR